jgi:hypothetical protein
MTDMFPDFKTLPYGNIATAHNGKKPEDGRERE